MKASAYSPKPTISSAATVQRATHATKTIVDNRPLAVIQQRVNAMVDTGSQLVAQRNQAIVSKNQNSLFKHRSGAAAIQRRIDIMPNSVDADKIANYIAKSQVNGRKQNFIQAKDEFLHLFPSYGQSIEKHWANYNSFMDGSDFKNAQMSIAEIAKIINDVCNKYPSYPNVIGHHTPENLHSIPQSEKSVSLSDKLALALSDAAKRDNDIINSQASDTAKQEAEIRLRHLLHYNEKEDSLNGYMIGVFITDDTVYATCSGRMTDGFREIAQSLGMVVINDKIKSKSAKNVIASDCRDNITFDEDDRLHQLSNSNEDVATGKVGSCAAAKLAFRSESSDIPDSLQDCSMTERWVSPLKHKSEVPIIDEHGKAIKYGHLDIVPSCKACQHLVPVLIEELKGSVAKKQANMAIRESILASEALMNEHVRKLAAANVIEGKQKLAENAPLVTELNNKLNDFYNYIEKAGGKSKQEFWSGFAKPAELTKNNKDLVKMNLSVYTKVKPNSLVMDDVVNSLKELENFERLFKKIEKGLAKYYSETGRGAGVKL